MKKLLFVNAAGFILCITLWCSLSRITIYVICIIHISCLHRYVFLSCLNIQHKLLESLFHFFFVIIYNYLKVSSQWVQPNPLSIFAYIKVILIFITAKYRVKCKLFREYIYFNMQQTSSKHLYILLDLTNRYRKKHNFHLYLHAYFAKKIIILSKCYFSISDFVVVCISKTKLACLHLYT